jgi:CRP-like cAMP-binding protein
MGRQRMHITSLLSSSEFFQGISRSSIQALAEISLPKNLNKHELLFTEGQKGYALYLLGTGRVQLYKHSNDGKEVVIKLIQPGEIFGEVILFEQDSYPVSARAKENSLVFLIPRHQVLCLFQNEGFRNDFIRMLMKKQRYLTEKILTLSSLDASEKLFRFLLEQYGIREEYTVSLSKKDVATAIGVMPETMSRTLYRLGKENILRWQDNRIILRKGFWEEFGE